jgi:K+-sensing histidine kinase KdpD
VGRYISRDGVALVAAVVAPLAVCGILVPFRNTLSSANSALILVVVIVGVASLGNRIAGALAAASAALWFDFFLTQPYERLSIARASDITTAILLLIVGVAVSQLAAYARRLQVVTITNADYLLHIQHTAQLVQSGAATNAVVNEVRTRLIQVLGLSGCRFEYGVLLGQHPRLEHDGKILSGRTHLEAQRNWVRSGDIELRVQTGDRYYGRYLLQPGPQNTPSLQARLVAVTLADQVAATFSGARHDAA